MPLTDLLTRAAMLSAPTDTTDLALLRAHLFARLRASGWAPTSPARALAPRAADSDEALLTALVRGEPLAFDALFERHAPRLNGYARRSLQPADAADAVQETFLVLFRKAETILAHAPVNIPAFLFATLRNKTIHLLARRARDSASTPLDESETSPEADGLATLLRRENQTRLATLLTRVCTPLEQEVVALDLDDRDGPEIAAALGLSLENVRVLRFRARAKLRAALREEEP